MKPIRTQPLPIPRDEAVPVLWDGALIRITGRASDRPALISDGQDLELTDELGKEADEVVFPEQDNQQKILVGRLEPTGLRMLSFGVRDTRQIGQAGDNAKSRLRESSDMLKRQDT